MRCLRRPSRPAGACRHERGAYCAVTSLADDDAHLAGAFHDRAETRPVALFAVANTAEEIPDVIRHTVSLAAVARACWTRVINAIMFLLSPPFTAGGAFD